MRSERDTVFEAKGILIVALRDAGGIISGTTEIDRGKFRETLEIFDEVLRERKGLVIDSGSVVRGEIGDDGEIIRKKDTDALIPPIKEYGSLVAAFDRLGNEASVREIIDALIETSLQNPFTTIADQRNITGNEELTPEKVERSDIGRIFLDNIPPNIVKGRPHSSSFDGNADRMLAFIFDSIEQANENLSPTDKIRANQVAIDIPLDSNSRHLIIETAGLEPVQKVAISNAVRVIRDITPQVEIDGEGKIVSGGYTATIDTGSISQLVESANTHLPEGERISRYTVAVNDKGEAYLSSTGLTEAQERAIKTAGEELKLTNYESSVDVSVKSALEKHGWNSVSRSMLTDDDKILIIDLGIIERDVSSEAATIAARINKISPEGINARIIDGDKIVVSSDYPIQAENIGRILDGSARVERDVVAFVEKLGIAPEQIRFGSAETYYDREEQSLRLGGFTLEVDGQDSNSSLANREIIAEAFKQTLGEDTIVI
jgi:hypothetical protein